MGFLKNLFGKSSQESKTSQVIETEKNTIMRKGTFQKLQKAILECLFLLQYHIRQDIIKNRT